MAAQAVVHYLPRFGAPPEPPPVPVNAVADAEDRGRREATAAAEARFEALRARDRADHEAALAAARREWTAAEGERLARLVSEGLHALESLVAGEAAAVLKPLVGEALRTRAVEELRSTVAALLSDPDHPPIRVSGPADLLDRIAASLGAGAAAVRFAADAAAEVTVTAGRTLVRTQFEAWAARLAGSAAEAGHG